jgi:hypothetical protein
MRKRILLLVAPICVVAIAASVAVAAPSDAEHGPKLDKLHAERPTAASRRTATVVLSDAGFQKAAKDIQTWYTYRQVTGYLGARIVGEYIASRIAEEAAAAQAAQAAQAAPAPVSSTPTYSSSYPGDFLACVRQRESGGNYAVYNAGGSGAAGAYQFMQGTWNGVAASSGRSDLIGVDPAQASPADQDAMAQALYAQQGSAPWGGEC